MTPQAEAGARVVNCRKCGAPVQTPEHCRGCEKECDLFLCDNCENKNDDRFLEDLVMGLRDAVDFGGA